MAHVVVDESMVSPSEVQTYPCEDEELLESYNRLKRELETEELI